MYLVVFNDGGERDLYKMFTDLRGAEKAAYEISLVEDYYCDAQVFYLKPWELATQDQSNELWREGHRVR